MTTAGVSLIPLARLPDIWWLLLAVPAMIQHHPTAQWRQQPCCRYTRPFTVRLLVLLFSSLDRWKAVTKQPEHSPGASCGSVPGTANVTCQGKHLQQCSSLELLRCKGLLLLVLVKQDTITDINSNFWAHAVIRTTDFYQETLFPVPIKALGSAYPLVALLHKALLHRFSGNIGSSTSIASFQVSSLI